MSNQSPPVAYASEPEQRTKKEETMMCRKEVSRRFGVSPRTISRLVASGRLSAYQIGSHLRFDPQDVETFLRAARIEGNLLRKA